MAAEETVLSGPDFMAIQIASRDFLHNKYSTSGDLKHFQIYLFRRPRELEIVFVPNQIPGKEVLGGQTARGLEVHYFVSPKTMEIVRHHFAK